MSTISQSVPKESAATKEVLVLTEGSFKRSEVENYWNQLIQNNSDIIVVYQNVSDFRTSPPNNKKYAMVIVNLHGYIEKNKPVYQYRSHHIVKTGDKLLTPTINFLSLCAQHTDKILLDSCYGGTVIKDLYAYNGLGAVEVVTVGSKY